MVNIPIFSYDMPDEVEEYVHRLVRLYLRRYLLLLLVLFQDRPHGSCGQHGPRHQLL